MTDLYGKTCQYCGQDVTAIVVMERGVTFCRAACADRYFGTCYRRALEDVVKVCSKARYGSTAYLAWLTATNALDSKDW